MKKRREKERERKKYSRKENEPEIEFEKKNIWNKIYLCKWELAVKIQTSQTYPHTHTSTWLDIPHSQPMIYFERCKSCTTCLWKIWAIQIGVKFYLQIENDLRSPNLSEWATLETIYPNHFMLANLNTKYGKSFYFIAQTQNQIKKNLQKKEKKRQ